MPRGRVRMEDVAIAAGVSRTTASFVLNGRDMNIPILTRERVQACALRLGYRRNATAVALVTGRTQRIGVVVNDPHLFDETDLYFTKVLTGVTQGAVRHKHNVLLHTVEHGNWQNLLTDILSPEADGTLLIGRYSEDPLTFALLDAGFPTVCISYQAAHAAACSVDCDNVHGGYLAARHLLALGHRGLALLYPGDRNSWGAQRRQGVLKALCEVGQTPEDLWILEWPDVSLPTLQWARESLTMLLSLRPRPTGIICANEISAQRITEAAASVGVSIPKDFSLISFNSTDQSVRSRPPMTSVAQPLRQIGESGVDVLIDLIEGRSPPQRQIVFPMHLDVRESCGPPGEDRTPSA